ncbi:Nuclear transcription factor Y subunit B-5 [Olea europaea subsp. europaea]|uniref:Nuclear transcription factor Y subunit B-5 n=1 Tax=Olea europaea subsp. europaea TaxID=158383 RepID=A0A8S0TX41_OLEEU|nr:Nuclear transcription factor Y subunit B-5 [Olea europaea subsp. europaea]
MHAHDSGFGFPSTVRISTGKGRGPDFVGQVFSMCDLSGFGLMSVSTNIDIPFLSKRTPEWLKKIYAALTKSDRKNGPFFRFLWIWLMQEKGKRREEEKGEGKRRRGEIAREVELDGSRI